MENEDGVGAAPTASDQLRNQQVDNAIRAIQQKKPPPEIDFTIHVMEDGTQVSTQERVCKGMEYPALIPLDLVLRTRDRELPPRARLA